MEQIIQKIVYTQLGDHINTIQEIEGLGSVNMVFDVEGNYGTYIIRLNAEPQRRLEYKKEQWCIEKSKNLGIPSPKFLKIGFQDTIAFMIQEKILGTHGKYCGCEEKRTIWEKLGAYASKYQQITRIEDKEVEESEFHKSWNAKLAYHCSALNKDDSLVKKGVLTLEEQQKAKKIVSRLQPIAFKFGLVHGDLCPRNVIWNKSDVYLLDWGTAEINVIPHTEIGIVLMSNEATQREFHCFLRGLGISTAKYKKIEAEIHALNLLYRLDKYRWADDHHVENIKEYEERVKDTLYTLVGYR